MAKKKPMKKMAAMPAMPMAGMKPGKPKGKKRGAAMGDLAMLKKKML